MHVAALYSSPVKSLALNRHKEARVTPTGIEGDRAFYIIDEAGRLMTQRECGALALVRAEYDASSEHLRLVFPDGMEARGPAETGEVMPTRFFHLEREALAVGGPFADALSAYAGQPLRLVKAMPGKGFDNLAISILSEASLDRLRSVAGSAALALNERRFRPNFLIAGAAEPHEEDSWIGKTVRIGGVAVRVVMRDPRCVMTTLDPDTGKQDLPTLKLIASYRTDQQKEVNFGVYADVERPGAVHIGDNVQVVAAGAVAGRDAV